MLIGRFGLCALLVGFAAELAFGPRVCSRVASPDPARPAASAGAGLHAAGFTNASEVGPDQLRPIAPSNAAGLATLTLRPAQIKDIEEAARPLKGKIAVFSLCNSDSQRLAHVLLQIFRKIGKRAAIAHFDPPRVGEDTEHACFRNFEAEWAYGVAEAGISIRGRLAQTRPLVSLEGALAAAGIYVSPGITPIPDTEPAAVEIFVGVQIPSEPTNEQRAQSTRLDEGHPPATGATVRRERSLT